MKRQVRRFTNSNFLSNFLWRLWMNSIFRRETTDVQSLGINQFNVRTIFAANLVSFDHNVRAVEHQFRHSDEPMANNSKWHTNAFCNHLVCLGSRGV
jgi:hypothetical protein